MDPQKLVILGVPVRTAGCACFDLSCPTGNCKICDKGILCFPGNSFLFAQALQEKKIPYTFHVFSKGKHGLSLADEAWANEEVKQWPELADEWIRTTL